MHLRPEDVQDIVSLLDSLSQDEFELRTSELHVTVRRAGPEGWTQESRVLSAPNVVATDKGGGPEGSGIHRRGRHRDGPRGDPTPDRAG